MPWTKVMSEYGKGKLHSGSKKGPIVKSRKQAIAIMLSEKRHEAGESEATKRMEKPHRKGRS